MPTIPIHLAPPTTYNTNENPLPELLQTPAGLAILEIQGTINLPHSSPSTSTTPVGRLVFPDYNPNDPTASKSWMKTVHLYVGKHQRLTGEVKKLANPVAVIKKREAGETKSEGEELDIVEIVYWKILFSTRPEPVGE